MPAFLVDASDTADGQTAGIRAGRKAEGELPVIQAALRSAGAQEKYFPFRKAFEAGVIDAAGQGKERLLVGLVDRGIIEVMRFRKVENWDCNIRSVDAIFTDADRTEEVGSDKAPSRLPLDISQALRDVLTAAAGVKAELRVDGELDVRLSR